jgi:cytochrome c oxidase subunit 3
VSSTARDEVGERGAGVDEAWLTDARDRAERGFRALGPPGRSSSWWGLAVGMVSLSTILGALAYAYAYLWVSADRWPPDGVEPPAPGWSVVGLALLVGAGAAWSSRAARLAGGAPAAAVAVGLGAAFTVVQGADVARSAHLVDEDAFWAITVTIQAAGVVLGAAGVGVGLVVVWLRSRTGWVEGTRLAALWWWFVGLAWPLLWLTTYVAPRVA